MPTIHGFDQGALKICVYADDHAPPHFHLIRNDGECLIALADLTVMIGDVDRRDCERAIAWARANRALLKAKWRDLNEGG